ncbi:hypothetical protein GCM10028807_07320 [Spirosoma daeguense]
MKQLFWAVAIILIQLAAVPLQAQSVKTTAEKLDEYLLSAQRAYRFNGVALVAQRGQILHHKAYGLRHVESEAPNDTITRFPILSITKSFTAALILKLQEQGKLSVDDKLSKYVPDIPNGDKITLHHLLTHTSGLFNFTDIIGEEDSAIVCHPVSKQLLLDLLKSRPVEFSPGKQFGYNNSGYCLLGMVIEKIEGKPYEQVMRELVFQPLGMNQSGFDFINLPKPIRAFGYDTLTTNYYSPYPHFDSTVVYSAGAMYSTTSDMLKWGKAVATQQLLSASSWKQAFKPRMNNYGYGWEIGHYINKSYIRHSGGYPGFMAEFVHFPDEDVTIILLNNFGNYGDSVFPTVMGLSSIVFGKPYDLWPARQPVTLDETTLKQYVGHYVLNRQFAIDIDLRNGQLYALGRNKVQVPELAMYASSQDKFFVWVYNNRVTFKRDASGRVIGLTIREHGEDTDWKKTD